MKFDDTLHITIIGMGRLMEALKPCYEKMLKTPEKLFTQVNAVTMDSYDLQGKNARLGFTVILGDNKKALEDNTPGLILFAPPPENAIQIAKQEILPYIEDCKKNDIPLPTIFAFPPSPSVDSYVDILGKDVKIIGCVPCLGTHNGGTTLITHPTHNTLSKQDIKMIENFFAPVGDIMLLSIDGLFDLLGSMCLFPLIYCLLSDVRNKVSCIEEISDQSVYITAAVGLEHLICDSQEQQDDPIQRLFTLSSVAWIRGIVNYRREANISTTFDSIAKEVINYLKSGAEMTEEQLQELHMSFATPGGIAELLLMEYRFTTRNGIIAFDKENNIESRIADYIESEAYRLCACASKRASTVHVPFSKGTKLSKQQLEDYYHILFIYAESMNVSIPDCIKIHLLASDEVVPHKVYSSCKHILEEHCEASVVQMLLWKTHIDFGARWGQSMAYEFICNE